MPTCASSYRISMPKVCGCVWVCVPMQQASRGPVLLHLNARAAKGSSASESVCVCMCVCVCMHDRRQEVLLHLNARAAKGSSASEGVTTALRRAGKVTAATWLKAGSGALGGSGGDFATGHESGDVLVRMAEQ